MTIFKAASQKYATLNMGQRFLIGCFVALLLAALAFTLSYYAFTVAFAIIALICVIAASVNW